ncbi:MAG: universal stress protein [Phycisphaerae bacterium]|nr:universal stress protein [Phycisphaerae bacterium]
MHDSLEQLLLQIAVILLAARLLGSAMRFIGQPRVVGEMLAGIMLGPSVLGLLAHGVWLKMLFPVQPGADPYPDLNILSQIGVVLFMFLVGLELDPKLLRNQGKALLIAGTSSLAGPLIAGIILGVILFPTLHGPVNNEFVFALFIGTAMCITAFPVLARIIAERNLQRTRVGAFALACGAFNDVIGWCLLALVIAVCTSAGLGTHKAEYPLASAAMTVVWTLSFGAFMLIVMPKLLRPLQVVYERRGYLSRNTLALILLLLLLSGCITEWIGIQAIFGGFLLGAAMPAEGRFVRHLTDKLEDLVLLLLLPIFFAYTGLRTQIGLLNTTHLWQICLLVLVVATVSKLACSSLAAKFAGLTWRQSGVLGALMNARGLIELIVLNIGLSLHVLSPAMFAIMVIMALATTFTTTPLLYLCYSPARQRRDAAAEAPEVAQGETRILTMLSSPLTAAMLTRIAALFLANDPGRILAMHLANPDEHEQRQNLLHPPDDPVEMAIQQAAKLKIPVNAISLVSRDFGRDICLNAAHYQAQWILLGGHRGLFSSAPLGSLADEVLRDAGRNVAILAEKNLADIRRVMVPYLGEPQDIGALIAADRLGRNHDLRVTILHVVKPGTSKAASSEKIGVQSLVDRHISSTGTANQIHFQVMESDSPAQVVVLESQHYDLIILGIAPQWQLHHKLLGKSQQSVADQAHCSVLIVQAAAPATSNQILPAGTAVPTPSTTTA